MGARGKKPTPVWKRVISRVVWDENDCWIWQGYVNKRTGYGQVTFNVDESGNRTGTCHVATYEWFHGPVPAGLQVDHLCRVRACCNPLHLEAVPQLINMQRGTQDRMVASLQDRCLKDHPLVGDNVIINKHGFRRCRICRDAYMKDYRANRKKVSA